MSLFKCESCNKKIEIKKQTLVAFKNKIVAKESWCKTCKKYMVDISKFEGFGTAFQAPTDKLKR